MCGSPIIPKVPMWPEFKNYVLSTSGLLYVGNFTRVVICWLQALPFLYAYNVITFVMTNKGNRVWRYQLYCFF